MSHQTQPDPIEELRRANPASAAELRANMSPEHHRAARDRAIAAGERVGELRPRSTAEPGPRRGGWLGRRTTLGVGAVLASAGVIAAVVILGGGSVGPGDQPEFAAAAVRVAEANPRLLVGEPGWSVTRADEFEPDQGSMTFSDGVDELNVSWQPAAYYVDFPNGEGSLSEPDQWYWTAIGCGVGPGTAERMAPTTDCGVFQRFTEIRLLGAEAILHEDRTIFPHRIATRFTLYLPPEVGAFVTITAGEMSRDQFLTLLDSLYETDVDSWLAALPPRIVQPLDRPEVVDEMLRDIPVPASVDVEALKDEFAASSRYSVGAAVTSAVACEWLDQWANAVQSGDVAAADEAIEAMSTSREWEILKEMESQGGWAQVIWEYAGEMRRDDRAALLGIGGTETLPDGRVYELTPSYATGIGCDSERRVLREEPGDPPDFPDPVRVPDAFPVPVPR
jgi:hypothetical protein